MVSVAVMKDPDGGAMQGSRAYVYKDVSSVTLCTLGNWCLVAALHSLGGEQHLTSGIDHDNSRTSCHRFG